MKSELCIEPSDFIERIKKRESFNMPLTGLIYAFEGSVKQYYGATYSLVSEIEKEGLTCQVSSLDYGILRKINRYIKNPEKMVLDKFNDIHFGDRIVHNHDYEIIRNFKDNIIEVIYKK